MLINNLEKHRSKYSSSRNFNGLFQRASSERVISNKCSKTQQRSKSRHTSRQNNTLKCLPLKTFSECSIKYKKFQHTFRQAETTRSRTSVDAQPSDRKIKDELKKLSIKKNNRIFFEEEQSILCQSKIRNPKQTERSSQAFHLTQENYDLQQSGILRRKIAEKKMKRHLNVIKNNLQSPQTDQNQDIQTATDSCEPQDKKISRSQIQKSASQFKKSTQASSIFQGPFYINTMKNEQIILDDPTILNEESFLKELKFTDVFFCMKCLRYIFIVQKYYHHPKCQNQVIVQNLSPFQKSKIGYARLEMIKELSEYTETKNQKIRKIYDLVSKKDTSEVKYDEIVKISPQAQQQLADRKYLGLSEIDLAMQVIVKRLLWEEMKSRDKQNNLKSFLKRKNIGFCEGIKLDCHNQLEID